MTRSIGTLGRFDEIKAIATIGRFVPTDSTSIPLLIHPAAVVTQARIAIAIVVKV